MSLDTVESNLVLVNDVVSSSGDSISVGSAYSGVD